MHFPDLPARLEEVRSRISRSVELGGHGQKVRIIAITKTHGPEAVREVVAAGVLDVGENKVQEALRKQAELRSWREGVSEVDSVESAASPEVRWHLIGHLQTNKARALEHFSLFHAVDRPRIANAAHQVGKELGRPVDILLQVNISGEESKGGFRPDELSVECDRLLKGGMEGVRVVGVMTMAPFEADERELRRVFGGARDCLGTVRAAGFVDATELSMGMSGDYGIAIEEGATMVRLGTVLFGARS